MDWESKEVADSYAFEHALTRFWLESAREDRAVETTGSICPFRHACRRFNIWSIEGEQIQNETFHFILCV